ncbi:TetR/AcrR family transcriptional regulator [Gordonia sp. HY285]|uniref:TetR/AcrR family transcriptional regulator n=1 Tax=Gordonia liuliyuniae TaxID=2911517 RepID=UPI001F1D449D|nr:TetR/AcrR family transcriptional regulator [Gordonia liuliyuniae]MCF8611312.1 TetR/AcrR family transcriptional regulator [Gordonia liuliyuniae]
MSPNPPRVSRADRRARTVADLVATARAAFLADGYSATSLDAIAEAAGYSKGAVYSNFKDKPSLCHAVLADIHFEKMHEVQSLTPTSDEVDVEAFVAEFGDWLRRSLGDIEWTMLEFEYVALSRGNQSVREGIIELRTEVRDAVAELLTRVLGGLLPTESGDDEFGLPTPTELADLVLSTGIGLSVQRAVDPSVSVEPAIDILTTAASLFTALGMDGPRATD